jgi:hypothetical protein
MSHCQTRITQTRVMRRSSYLCFGLLLAGPTNADQTNRASEAGATQNMDAKIAVVRACDSRFNAQEPDLKRRCGEWERELAKIEKSTLGKWIELESGKADRRVFVAVPQQTDPFSGTKRRIHLRDDNNVNSVLDPAIQRNAPPTTVRTLDLDCWHGETTLIATQIYDKKAKVMFS